MNSQTQTLNIIKANPGLCGEKIGERCTPQIQVNTVVKNICHIRRIYGDDCIETVMVAGVNPGVEFATYYWRGVQNADTKEYIRVSRERLANYPPDHIDRIKEEAYLLELIKK